MPNAADIKPEGRFLGLFIGRSGSGKSAAAYSFADAGDVYVFDIDGRIRGGLLPWIDRKKITYDYFPPGAGATQNQLAFYQKINQQCEVMQVAINTRNFPYKTIVVDSATWTALNLLSDAVPLTHQGTGEKGKFIGQMMMAGPQDYGFQSTGIYNLLKFLRTVPANIIVTAHIVAKWGKKPGSDNNFEANVVVGEQLAMTDKLAEALPSSFDHVVYFKKYEMSNGLQFTAKFHGELARTAFSQIPYGEMDVTGKSFYAKMMSIVGTEVAGGVVTVK